MCTSTAQQPKTVFSCCQSAGRGARFSSKKKKKVDACGEAGPFKDAAVWDVIGCFCSLPACAYKTAGCLVVSQIAVGAGSEGS